MLEDVTRESKLTEATRSYAFIQDTSFPRSHLRDKSHLALSLSSSIIPPAYPPPRQHNNLPLDNIMPQPYHRPRRPHPAPQLPPLCHNPYRHLGRAPHRLARLPGADGQGAGMGAVQLPTFCGVYYEKRAGDGEGGFGGAERGGKGERRWWVG